MHEAQRTEAIHQSLIDKGLPPSEHFVDSAYVSGEHLVNATEQQIEIVGPARQNASWQSKTEGAYDEATFDIDWSQESVTCPQGKHSKSWKPRVQDGGRTYIQVRFSARECGTCSAKELCTRGVQRSLAFLPQAEYKALEQTRELHRSEAGQERYKRRAGIEGTISQGVRSFGLWRSRYRGLAKTHLQNVAIGAAINIDRLVNWINGVPLEKTRVSRFKALEVA